MTGIKPKAGADCDEWPNRIDTVMYFTKVICQFSLDSNKVHLCKIADKREKFLLNYGSLFWGPLFIWTQCR